MKRLSVSLSIAILLGFWVVVSLAFARGSEALTFARYEPTAVPTVVPADDGEEEVVVSSGVHSGGHAVTVTRTITKVDSDNANPSEESGRDDPANPDASVEAGWPSPDSPQCAYVYRPVLVASGESLPSECLEAWVCGGERIDDVVSGDVAGEEASGRYAELLAGVVGLAGSVSNSPLPDINSVSDFLIDRGLSREHDEDQLPEFYWCGKMDEATREVTLEVVSADPTRWPRFGWTTSIEAEYNVPGLRADSLLALEALLGLNEPELAAVPPITNGFTWVKWPTWFWVDSDTEPLEVWDENDAGTVRIDMRAVVDRVEWTFDGKPVQVCTLDQMLAYNEQAHDPVTDAPECTYRFLQAISADLEATVFYNVEERIRSRVANKNADYANTPWVPTPGVGQLPLSTVVADYRVREIYSVNTPINMTDEEIAELLRNE